MVPAASYAGNGTYSWSYTGLQPFENREILMTLNVNSPAVNIGDVLPFTATVNSFSTDTYPNDNTYAFNQEVTGFYEPNNIVCIEGEKESTEAIGDYLHYVVNFKNTGTAAADFIVIKHEINPADFDISSLQVLNSSHKVVGRITGNTLEFIFSSIKLSAADHGNILFKLKTKQDLKEGDSVLNKASIYFDYNQPVQTNNANTTFEVLGTEDFIKDISVQVYPNPANNNINITAEDAIKTMQLYDVQGRILQTVQVNNTVAVFDISARASGIYFLKVQTVKGIKVEKIIKK